MSEIHRMIYNSPDADDLFIFDGDIKAAAIGAEYTRGMHPPIRFAFDAHVDIDSGFHKLAALLPVRCFRRMEVGTSRQYETLRKSTQPTHPAYSKYVATGGSVLLL